MKSYFNYNISYCKMIKINIVDVATFLAEYSWVTKNIRKKSLLLLL